MYNRRCIFLSFAVLIVLSIGSYSSSKSQDLPLLFLKGINSPSAIGMGGCVVNNVDETSSLYNPAAFGLLSLDNIFSFSFPHKNRIYSFADDMTLNTFSIGGGYSLIPVSLLGMHNPKIAFGLSFSVQKLGYGKITITDSQGNILGSEDPYDRADIFSLSTAIDYYLRVGLGFNYKKLKSKLIVYGAGAEPYEVATGSAIDYGIIFELPIMKFIPHTISFGDSEKYYLNFDLTPSLAYVKANIGDDMNYIDVAQADPLPRISRTGISLYAAINSGKANVVSARSCRQTEKNLVGNSKNKVKSNGYEIGFLGCFYLRRGESDTDSDNPLKAKGYGIRLGGLIKWLQMQGLNFGDGIPGYIANNIDITYDFAEYSEIEREYVKINLSI